MIRVVISFKGLNGNSVVAVLRSILCYSNVVSKKATASSYSNCKEIVFSSNKNILMQEFTYFVHFLYTSTIKINSLLSLHSFPKAKDVSN
jgi:hypothetical protein